MVINTKAIIKQSCKHAKEEKTRKKLFYMKLEICRYEIPSLLKNNHPMLEDHITKVPTENIKSREI